MNASKWRVRGANLGVLSSLLLLGCGTGSSDSDRFSTLDRLRVLGVRSVPADIAPSETAKFDALVYAPPGQTVKYAWSWCPSRADETGGFQCWIAEEDLIRAWAKASIVEELPPYDLGTEPEATWSHVFTQENLGAVCRALTEGEAEPEQAAGACLYQMVPSLELKVETKTQKLVALRTLPLLFDEPPSEQRNLNPELGESVTLPEVLGGRSGGSVSRVVAGRRYAVEADVEPSSSQSFTPSAESGGTRPEARRERLVLNWFMTVGVPSSTGGEDGAFSGEEATTFVDGANTIDDLTQNGWQLPANAKPQEAELVLVLADERGGVDWARYRFEVEANQ